MRATSSRTAARARASSFGPMATATKATSSTTGAKARAPTPDELERFYALYRNVKTHSFELNTFPLPKDIFDPVVDALAAAFMLDYQQDTDRMVRSPRGKDHDIERGRS